jgi:hypothetical protein
MPHHATAWFSPERQDETRRIDLQLVRAEQPILGADQVVAAANRSVQVAEHDRQPKPEPLLGLHEFRFRVTVERLRTGRLREARDEAHRVFAAHDGGRDLRGQIKAGVHVALPPWMGIG